MHINKLVGREKIQDGRLERQIITAMIVSTTFLKEIMPIFKEDGLKIPFARSIARWIVDYYEKYDESPGKQIEDIFRDQKNNIHDPDEASMIEEFLSSISEEYSSAESFNSSYILDKAETHFRSQALTVLTKNINKALVGGRVDEAEALAKGFERSVRMKTQGIDPIFDTNIISRMFDENSGDKLFSFPGVLGEIIGELERGWLFSFIGASGTGKTWFLMMTALRALFAGYNVVFFSLEMSESEMAQRIQHWINGLPSERFAGEMNIPVFDCLKNRNGSCRKFKRTKPICTACINTPDFEVDILQQPVTKKALTAGQAVNKSNAIKRSALLRGNRFKLVTLPSKSITMSGVDAYLHNMEHYDGFVPDVIITDYADKLLAEDTRLQYRHQVASIWEKHKSMALERKCLVVTASQSNTARTGANINQGDFAESITKLELLDGGVAINMTAAEKEKGFLRMKYIKSRHGAFNTEQEIGVLHQLKIGRPYLDSCLIPIKNKKDDDK